MTRLSRFYAQRDITGARQYIDELFCRMVRLYKPSRPYALDRLRLDFIGKIEGLYFDEASYEFLLKTQKRWGKRVKREPVDIQTLFQISDETYYGDSYTGWYGRLRDILMPYCDPYDRGTVIVEGMELDFYGERVLRRASYDVAKKLVEIVNELDVINREEQTNEHL